MSAYEWVLAVASVGVALITFLVIRWLFKQAEEEFAEKRPRWYGVDSNGEPTHPDPDIPNS